MDQGSLFSSHTAKPLNIGPKVEQLNESIYQLYKPLEKPNVQVVFFHGFQHGDCEDAHLSTWKSGDGSCVWPRTWLREKYPHAHILSVSYNAHLTKSRERGDLGLFLIGENLLSDLLAAEIGQDPRCPVILVGHGFGGLVIKEICARAHERNRDWHINFLDNLKGVFFYSTPHRGIDLERHASWFMSKSKLWKDVKILGVSTCRLNDNFENLQKDRDWQIAGVGESVPIPWAKGGELMVEEGSSRYGHDFHIVANADHISISRPKDKFSPSFLCLTTLIKRVVCTSKVAGSIHQSHGLPDHPSGLEKRAIDVKKMLKEATVLGVVGMGGIGKTTIAKEVFNDISREFEYTCFVDNAKGKQELDEWLLNHFYQNGARLDEKMREWGNLKGKKTLIVLDDVDSEDLLRKAFIPNLEHFGTGSCLIMTSRDEEVLSIYPNPKIYQVEFLQTQEASKLLCQHAFNLDKIPSNLIEQNPELIEMVNGVVEKCQGLPLSLEVVGCYMRPHRKEVRFWKETISRLGKAQPITGNTNDRLWASLRISYDALLQEEKEMFLEAGTWFFEKPLEEAIAVWSIRFEYAQTSWCNLLRKSMVKVAPKREDWSYGLEFKIMFGTPGEEIWVHEHLRDFARELMGNKMYLFGRPVQEKARIPNAI